jgi:hypothetical protein
MRNLTISSPTTKRNCAISTTRSRSEADRRERPRPAKKDLDYIAGLKTLDDVAAAMGDPRLQLDGPMGGGIGINEKNPDAYAIDLDNPASECPIAIII